jgi:hypothetical protein
MKNNMVRHNEPLFPLLRITSDLLYANSMLIKYFQGIGQLVENQKTFVKFLKMCNIRHNLTVSAQFSLRNTRVNNGHFS